MTKDKVIAVLQWVAVAIAGLVVATLTWLYGKPNPAAQASRRRRLQADQGLARARSRAEAARAASAKDVDAATAHARNAIEHAARARRIGDELSVITEDIVAPIEDANRADRFNARRDLAHHHGS